MPEPTDLPLPLHGRRIDALLHQIFVAPVLMTGRGPFANGITVPAYTTVINEALNLIDKVLPGWDWAVGRQNGVIHALLSASDGLENLEIALKDTADVTAASTLVAVMLEIRREIESEGIYDPVSAPETLFTLVERSGDATHQFGPPLALLGALKGPELPQEA